MVPFEPADGFQLEVPPPGATAIGVASSTADRVTRFATTSVLGSGKPLFHTTSAWPAVLTVACMLRAKPPSTLMGACGNGPTGAPCWSTGTTFRLFDAPPI